MLRNNKTWWAGVIRGMAYTRRTLAEAALLASPEHVSDEALLHYRLERSYLIEADNVLGVSQ